VVARDRRLCHDDIAAAAAPYDDGPVGRKLDPCGGCAAGRAPARPRPPLARDVGDQHPQLGERSRGQDAVEAVLEGLDAQIALDAARPQQVDGPLAIAVGGAHHGRDAPPLDRLRQGRQTWISHS
jgi:hypothetical protein